jgi:hypothetical protein
VIVVVVVVLVVTLGGGDSESTKSTDTNSTATRTNFWTSAEENAFLSSCTGGGAPSSTCRGALGKVEARYPDPADLQDLTAAERTDVGRQAALDCR